MIILRRFWWGPYLGGSLQILPWLWKICVGGRRNMTKGIQICPYVLYQPTYSVLNPPVLESKMYFLWYSQHRLWNCYEKLRDFDQNARDYATICEIWTEVFVIWILNLNLWNIDQNHQYLDHNSWDLDLNIWEMVRNLGDLD